MNKKIKLILGVGLIGVGIFLVNVAVRAATATCIEEHAGYCSVLGLNTGGSKEVDFNVVKSKLEAYYNKHSSILGYSYMEYSGGFWYWRCGNMNVIRFTDVEPPCDENDWGSYGDCSEDCDGGVQYRYNDCGTRSPARICNTQPCCGGADRESYERTSEVTAATRCDVGDTVSNWVDNSGLAAASGIAWTWNCNDGNKDSDQCLAYKKGECEYDSPDSPNNPPYDTREDGCRFGTLNSARLVNGILYWKCGTGEADKTVGNFFFNNPGDGALVKVDYYGPKEGGVDCRCTPEYEYECVGLGTYIGSCTNNCGGTIEEDFQAVKKDVSCFLGESLFITKEEYYVATGNHCTNKVIQCAPCGTQDADGGIHHETN